MRSRFGVLFAACAAGCSGDPAPPAPASCRAVMGADLLADDAPAHLVAVSVNYSTGRVREVSLADLSSRLLPIEAPGGDTVVRPLGSTLAVLHRAVGVQDNVTLFDRRAGGATYACQLSLVSPAEAEGARSRPYANAHDVIAPDASRLYVARHNMPSLAVVDLATGAIARTIDLTPYQGRGLLPYPDAFARVNGEVWVTLERDDDATRQRPTERGAIVRIDPRTDRVVGMIELIHPNPIGAMYASPDGSRRLVATLGSYNVVGDGAVEAVDVATGAVRELVNEDAEDVRGNIDAFAVVDAHRLVLRVSALREGTADINNLRVVLYDTTTHGGVAIAHMTQWGGAAPVVVGDRIYVGDPGAGASHDGAGLRVYTLDGHELRTVALDPGLFPYDVQPSR